MKKNVTALVLNIKEIQNGATIILSGDSKLWDRFSNESLNEALRVSDVIGLQPT